MHVTVPGVVTVTWLSYQVCDQDGEVDDDVVVCFDDVVKVVVVERLLGAPEYLGTEN